MQIDNATVFRSKAIPSDDAIFNAINHIFFYSMLNFFNI